MIDRMTSECRACRERGHCPFGVKGAPVRPEDCGAPLVAAAALVFLLPLTTAITAAFVGGRWAAPRPESVALWQLGGAAWGLLAGVVLARVLTALGRRAGRHW
jgi:hypothetical protein